MNAEKAQKREQDPGDRVVDRSSNKPVISLPVHRGNQEQIDDPAYQEKAASEKPNGAGNRVAIIKPMRTGKAKYPKQVADDLAVRVW